MSETSSPTVIPALTKTDARELRSLVKKDTQILLDELDYRRSDFMGQIHEQGQVELGVIQEELTERVEADARANDAVFAKIQRRIDSLNKAIVETLTDLGEAGWTDGRYGGSIDPHRHTVVLPDTHRLLPPNRDNSDLDDQSAVIRAKVHAMEATLQQEYQVAKRDLETEEASIHRNLTLQSITTEAAQEFILGMPEVESLLPTPEALKAIESA